jgi:hypothetical protein
MKTRRSLEKQVVVIVIAPKGNHESIIAVQSWVASPAASLVNSNRQNGRESD